MTAQSLRHQRRRPAHSALLAASRLTRERAPDRIKVPVPDGDTGTGVRAPRHSGTAERRDEDHCGRLLAAAADAALDGARGNSGAIFAQYFQGLADATTDLERLLPDDLGRVLATAADYARSALDDPQEGTVLTVMTDVAKALRPGAVAGSGFRALLPVLLEAARRAVDDTRNVLDAVRAAGVEDAGALALLVIFEGMAEGLEPGVERPVTGTAADPYADLRDHVDVAHGGPSSTATAPSA